MASASPQQSPTCLAASTIARKYRRIRGRPSPINDQVRRRLLSKLTNSSGGEQPVLSDPVNPRGAIGSVSTCTLGGDPMMSLSVAVHHPSLLQVLEEKYQALNYEEAIEHGRKWMIIYRVFTQAMGGPLQNPRLCIVHEAQSSHFYWQIYYSTIQDGVYANPSDIEMYLEQLLPSSGYVVCPGIRSYPDQIRFTTKNLRQWGPPFNRMFSATCAQWHIPNNVQQSPESLGFDCCKSCKQLLHDINQLAQRAVATTDTQRVIRTLPSSNYPLSKLSPSSQKTRIGNIMIDRKNLTRMLNRLQQFDCTVSDKQHAELLEFVSSVHKSGSKVIKELIEEGSRVLGDENVLKDSWHQDVVERLDYERDQHRSVTKNRSNRWNQVTIRMALAVYSRSPAAYEALKSFKLVQLPSVRTLKYYVDGNLESAGDSTSRIMQSRKEYVAMVEEMAKEKADKMNDPDKKILLPLSKGTLIIDEVKVGMKLLWSSRSQKFIGHSMTHDELASLCDVYDVLQPDYRKRQTTYVLQTLWRDLTSDFDVIGPHYTNDSPFSHHNLCHLLLDSIHQFHVCGFETDAVICDGASPNMTMVKEMSGAPRKAYSVVAGSDVVKPFFLSPYTGRSVYFIICPSHQLKNMVSALFQSRPPERGGTRNFIIGECVFGWTVIEDMYRREISRIRAGQCSRVPKLKENHIRRDSWTRLNVLPSKIMQQDEVLAELKEYARSDPKPQDAQAVELVVSYLEALNKIFERSILGKKVRVFDANGTTLQRMEEGFMFFSKWAKENQDEDEDRKSFLAWQTWDLLRIMWFGFRGLVQDFTTTNPGYHVNPKRVNGSAVETIFSQLKHTTSSNLTAANYESAKATLLTRVQSKGKDAYRSATLYLRQSDLARIPKSS